MSAQTLAISERTALIGLCCGLGPFQITPEKHRACKIKKACVKQGKGCEQSECHIKLSEYRFEHGCPPQSGQGHQDQQAQNAKPRLTSQHRSAATKTQGHRSRKWTTALGQGAGMQGQGPESELEHRIKNRSTGAGAQGLEQGLGSRSKGQENKIEGRNTTAWSKTYVAEAGRKSQRLNRPSLRAPR